MAIVGTKSSKTRGVAGNTRHTLYVQIVLLSYRGGLDRCFAGKGRHGRKLDLVIVPLGCIFCSCGFGFFVDIVWCMYE